MKSHRESSFPEPGSFNGQDDRPMGSAHGKAGPRRKQLKESLYMACRIYGVLTVQECLDEVVEELK